MRDGSADPAQIREWWSRWPTANVGLLTGEHFVALDVDPGHGGDDSLAALEAEIGPLPATPLVLTGGGGRHFYFSNVPGLGNSASRLGPGLDIRGSGGYLVAPPSVHASGRAYAWELSSDVADVPLAPMPREIIERLSTSSPPQRNGTVANGLPSKGSRNQTLAALVGARAAKGESVDDVRRWALGWNRDLSEPLPEREVLAVVASIAQTHARNHPAPAPAAPREWPALRPIGSDVAPPAFPVEAFHPRALRIAESATDLARAKQVPPDLVFSGMLPVAGIALAHKVRLEVRPGYFEPPALWMLGIAEPGSRKTAVLEAVRKPIEEWESRQREITRPDIARAINERVVLEKRLGHLQAEAAKAPIGNASAALAEANDIAARLASMPRVEAPRLIVEQSTTERLVTLLAAHNERLLAMASEGDALGLWFGHYSDGKPQLGALLSAYSGERILVDRVGRESVAVERPLLGIDLLVQPEAVRAVLCSRQSRGLGFLDRVLLCAPSTTVGSRTFDSQPESPSLALWWAQAVGDLLRSDIPATPRTVTLTPAAVDVFRAFFAEVERELAPGQGRLGDGAAWGGKLFGNTARAALVLHALEHHAAFAGLPADLPPLSGNTATLAVALGKYWFGHFLALTGSLGGDPAVYQALRLIAWIKRRSLAAFSRREAFTALVSATLPRVEDLDPALELLEDAGHVRRTEAGQAAGRRYPGAVRFEVRPTAVGVTPASAGSAGSAGSHSGDRTQNGAVDPASAGSAGRFPKQPFGTSFLPSGDPEVLGGVQQIQRIQPIAPAQSYDEAMDAQAEAGGYL